MILKNRSFIGLLAAIAAAGIWGGCSTKGLYYFPNKELYRDPAEAGLSYEMVTFPSANGSKLFGLYFKADAQPPKGVILHFHGNYGNVSHHFGQSAFLLRRGFDVFLFDYQGFGASEGKPTPQCTVEDGLAAIRYLESSTASAHLPIGLFGQSIGAAAATVVAARSESPRAVVLEAGFHSYKGIMKDVLKRSWLLKPLAYVVPWMIAQRGLDPVDYIGRISPRPVYIIHGDRDRTVPYWMGEALIAAAREPKKFWAVEGADHLQCRLRQGAEYERSVADFFAAAFEKARDSTSGETSGGLPANLLRGTGESSEGTPGSILPVRK